MNRCIQLALSGAGNVAPNPMVGAVLVYEDRIIGEGYHKKYGEAHAEVNCIKQVKEADQPLIEKSTLYVSLEPCSHFGKTPPCTDLIIQQKIKKVVIGCEDIFKEVAGKGIKKLQQAGVEVIAGVLGEKCKALNKRFFTFHEKSRPYIILKWAQSINGKIGSWGNNRVPISNEYSNRLVHKWRSEEAGILVGTNTALQDDPLLTTRIWNGKNPIRIVIDKQLQLPATLQIFNREARTLIFNSLENSSKENLEFIKLDDNNFLGQLIHSLFELNIQSIIVEGGTKTLQSFIDKGWWDEARVITNKEMVIENGISAPEMKDFTIEKNEELFSDLINYYKPKGI